MVKLILASQSPRRRNLVHLLGYPVQMVAADVDEESVMLRDPARNALETTRLKAEAIKARPEWRNGRGILLAADTNVAFQSQILGKPRSNAEAAHMLQMLRGNQHQVHTGIILLDLETGVEASGVHSATVTMRDYSDADIAAYVETGDPFDKAGAYAIQHSTFRPVRILQGCYLGVMGLSLCHVLQLLAQLHVPIAADYSAIKAAHQGYTCPIFPQLSNSG
jgi:septum formation protein